MKLKDIKWENIHNLEDHFITYLLYMEGKSVDKISIIRKMDKISVEKQIIKSKIFIENNKVNKTEEDILIKIISMSKKERIGFISKLNVNQQKTVVENIYKRYTKFKNPEDKMLLLWTVGELKDEKLLPLLRMELKSKNVNLRRIACSALGKIKSIDSKSWLENVINDENPQVRQYAIKALAYVGDLDTVNMLRNVIKRKGEKDYVIRAAKETAKTILNT